MKLDFWAPTALLFTLSRVDYLQVERGPLSYKTMETHQVDRDLEDHVGSVELIGYTKVHCRIAGADGWNIPPRSLE